MYSVRLTTRHHGKATFYLMLAILVITFTFYHYYGSGILIMYLCSVGWHLIIETALHFTGMRKGTVYLGTYRLPKSLEIIQRSMVEGPAFCVPAYLVSSQWHEPNPWPVIWAILVVILGSIYLAKSDYNNLKKSEPEEKLYMRRAMNNPVGMVLLAFINTGLLFFIFQHSYTWLYLIFYALFVVLFYAIHFPFGVRYIELERENATGFYRPNFGIQALGLLYDSAFEMTLLISPAYLLPYYWGWIV